LWPLGSLPAGQRISSMALYNPAIGVVGALAPEFGYLICHLLTMRPAMVLLAGFRVVTTWGS
jgi:hypothetical protein